MNRRPWIWLVAGTAEGRAAAIALLGLSIPVRVQLVSERARRPYRDLED
ncbi:MAG: precorrin-6x reductase, partial [Aphanocapsa feldmannii 277cI]